MLIMDGCGLGSTLNGNKFDDTVDSDLKIILEGDDVDGEESVDDNLEVLNHIVLG